MENHGLNSDPKAMKGTKITINKKDSSLEVYVVSKTSNGYLVTEQKFAKGKEPKGIFHVTDNKVVESK